MAYSDTVLRRARARLAQAKEDRERENDRRIAAIYDAHPRLREVDNRLRVTVAQAMAAAFQQGQDPSEAIARLRAENLALQQERAGLLERAGIDEADLRATPVCPHCGGSGYIGERMCQCLQALCREEQKHALSTLLAGDERFESFRLDCYPDVPDPQLGVSPRVWMQQVFQQCRRYARDFSTRSPSLLFSGGPGLGKTFLSAAIARTVADSGFSVAYESAGQIFADFEAEKFGGGGGELTEKYRRCDLLILDDLGTELTTQFTLSALYALLNGRLLEELPTVVSTNLTTDELRRRYTPQIASRLLGRFELLLFVGNDIRMRRPRPASARP